MEEAHERGARRPAGSFRTLALLLLSAGALVLWRAQPWQAPHELLVDDRRHDGAGPMERGADSRGEFDVGAPLSLLLLFLIMIKHLFTPLAFLSFSDTHSLQPYSTISSMRCDQSPGDLPSTGDGLRRRVECWAASFESCHSPTSSGAPTFHHIFHRTIVWLGLCNHSRKPSQHITMCTAQ